MKVFFCLAIALALFFATVASVSCTAPWQCSDVTLDYNYASCVNGACACKSNLGFDGSATPSDKCRCDVSKSIIWKNNVPYCIDLQEGVNADNAKQRCTILKNKVNTIYTNLAKTKAIAIAIDPSLVYDIFNPAGTKGKVEPLGRFDDDAFIRYFYALLAGTNAIAFYPIEVVCQGNTVAVRYDILVNSTDGFPAGVFNYTEVGFFYFDQNNLVVAADLALQQLGQLNDFPAFLQPFIVQQVCASLNGNPSLGQTQGICSGPNQQFASFSDCNSQLSSKPFGSWNNAASDTVICRLLHSLIANFDPSHHCPHAGPNGGNSVVGYKCIDFAYSDWYSINDVRNPFPGDAGY